LLHQVGSKVRLIAFGALCRKPSLLCYAVRFQSSTIGVCTGSFRFLQSSPL
jgi:hypothetical protein